MVTNITVVAAVGRPETQAEGAPISVIGGRDLAVEVRRQMVAEVACVVAGTVYEGGLAAAEELDAHQVHAG